MTSSFNAFGQSNSVFDNPSVPVWLGKVRPVPVGGTLAASDLVAGAKYAAGSPINIASKVVKVFKAWEVVSFTSGATDDTITVKPYAAGKAIILPAVNDFIMKMGATFAATGKAAKVTAVAPSTTDGAYDITVAHSATVDTPSAGDFIAISSATAAGSSKSLANVPNAYLYNDVCLGDIDVTAEGAGASAAAVQFHGEGILINRTPSAPFAALMAAAVPHVLQVNY